MSGTTDAGDGLGQGPERRGDRGAPAGQALVLIAEDEGAIALIVRRVVLDAGYAAEVTRNGRDALDLARARQPALIITDLMMPFMTGAQLIAAVRAEAAARGEAPPSIILMTAAGAAPARAAGADAILLKPFTIEELAALLGRFLNSGPAAPPQG